MKTKCLLLLTCLQLLTHFTPAFAGRSDGGANAVDGVLYDLYQHQRIVEKTTKELIAENRVLQNYIKNVDAVAYKFSLVLTTHKEWLFLKDINLNTHTLCKNAILFSVKTKVVACQQERYIFVDYNWFYREANEASRAGAIIHEFLVGLAQRLFLYDKPESKAAAEFEIQRFVGKAVFNTYTLESIEKFFNVFSELVDRRKTIPFLHVISYEEGLATRAAAEKYYKDLCEISGNLQLAADYVINQTTLEPIAKNLTEALQKYGAFIDKPEVQHYAARLATLNRPYTVHDKLANLIAFCRSNLLP